MVSGTACAHRYGGYCDVKQQKTALTTTPAGLADGLKKSLEEARQKHAELEQHKAALKAKAEQGQKNYDDLNFCDDQFDLSDTAVSVAVGLLATTSLGAKTLAILPTIFGVVMGLAGLLAWKIHPDFLIQLLS